MRPGYEYMLEGVVFDFFEGKDGQRVSFTFAQCAPTTRSLLTIPLTFDQVAIDLLRDCKNPNGDYDITLKTPPIIVNIENDTDELDKMLDKMNPLLIGHYQLPGQMSNENLCIEKMDKSKEIGFRGKDAKEWPSMLCVQNTETTGHELVVHFGGYKTTFEPFQMDIESWTAIGPNIIPHLCGKMFGEVNRKKTAEYSKPDNIDGLIALDEATILDMPKIIQRVGVPMDKAQLDQFFDKKAKPSDEVEGYANVDPNVAILTNSSMVERVTDAEFYVISNYNLNKVLPRSPFANAHSG
jgi:hypothetical protein